MRPIQASWWSSSYQSKKPCQKLFCVIDGRKPRRRTTNNMLQDVLEPWNEQRRLWEISAER
jgi:hypothetical protein